MRVWRFGKDKGTDVVMMNWKRGTLGIFDEVHGIVLGRIVAMRSTETKTPEHCRQRSRIGFTSTFSPLYSCNGVQTISPTRPHPGGAVAGRNQNFVNCQYSFSWHSLLQVAIKKIAFITAYKHSIMLLHPLF